MMQRQPQHQPQAAKRTVFGLHPAAMLVDSRLDYCQAEAGAAGFAVARLVGAIERTEDLLAVFGADAGAVVVNRMVTP